MDHQKMFHKKVKKILSENDPYDRVILHLMITGIWNVVKVVIGGESTNSQGHSH